MEKLKILKNLQKEKLIIIGLLAIVVSGIIYSIELMTISQRDIEEFEGGALFIICFGISILYFLAIQISSFRKNKWKFYKQNKVQYNLSLILFSISAFSLNAYIPVFSKFVVWVSVVIIFLHVILLFTSFSSKIPALLRKIVYFLAGIETVFAVYCVVYCAPIIPFGFILFLFFGISLHIFVPLLWTISLIFNVLSEKQSKSDVITYVSGIILAFCFVGFIMMKWQKTAKIINNVSGYEILMNDAELPSWVALAQKLPKDRFTEKIIKGEYFYDGLDYTASFWDFGMNNFATTTRHDPIVTIGLLLHNDIPLNGQERYALIESFYDARHEAHRRLWRGENLITKSIVSNTKLYADYRFAYTEKTISIKNTNNNRWSSPEEAVYTFYLPEGSIATSLSLWINGKEEKSRLTTRQKADSAYSTIVGREARDPALLHWQEGNRITVTVFPCTNKEDRKFKIGITYPLKYEEGQLTLKDIWFKGPDFNRTYETNAIEIISDHHTEFVKFPSEYKKLKGNTFMYQGNYKRDEKVILKSPPLSNKAFNFSGNRYIVSEAQTKIWDFIPEEVYLDINKGWNKKELDNILSLFQDKKIYVFNENEFLLLTTENKKEMFSYLTLYNFTLFPFHKLENQNSMVITKSSQNTPFLNEIKGSVFSNDLKKYFKKTKTPVFIVDIGAQITPYLTTLKELKAINYFNGSVNEITGMINKGFASCYKNDSNTVVLEESKIRIIKTEGENGQDAPDHLMRLFNYSQIMTKMGEHYFENEKYSDGELIELANAAYVVSPVSSLVVLESIADYERFDIKENKNSLKNASAKSSGATPEPHEWVLIIFGFSFILFLYIRKRKANIQAKQ